MKWFSLTVTAGFVLCATVQAQHLWWDLEGQKNATCLYGQITVLATAPHIYYCGANWHPGEPASGYCGIQHISEKERRTIFSIWDTSPGLHPAVIAADPRTFHNRFGGEGEGGHTHMIWPWKVGEVFQFFVRKVPGTGDTTDTSYCVYDRMQKHWVRVATIRNPNGGKPSVKTIGGGMNSFLENFAGKDRSVPKLVLYRLWLGPDVDTMKCLTKAVGDGSWGQLHGAYFLAEGDPAALNHVFSQLNDKYGQPVMGQRGKKLEPIPDSRLPEKLLAALRKLPTESEVGDE